MAAWLDRHTHKGLAQRLAVCSGTGSDNLLRYFACHWRRYLPQRCLVARLNPHYDRLVGDSLAKVMHAAAKANGRSAGLAHHAGLAVRRRCARPQAKPPQTRSVCSCVMRFAHRR